MDYRVYPVCDEYKCSADKSGISYIFFGFQLVFSRWLVVPGLVEVEIKSVVPLAIAADCLESRSAYRSGSRNSALFDFTNTSSVPVMMLQVSFSCATKRKSF